MTNPWDKNQGYNGPPESYESYERFKSFLRLGPQRSIPELANRIGISRQAMGKTARKYNWMKRAEAWDAKNNTEDNESEEEKIRQSTTALPPPPEPPLKTSQELIPEKPEIVNEIVSTIQTEVVSDVLQTQEAMTQFNKWNEYQERFCILGREMLDDADQIRGLALLCHADLKFLWQTRLKALKDGNLGEAALMCTQIKDLTPQYWKLRELVRGHRQDARLHWGDAIGVKAILEAAYKPKKE